MSGFIMSATRIVGIPVSFSLVFGKLLDTLFSNVLKTPGSLLKAVRSVSMGCWLSACISAAGGGAFFVFCWWKFGQWDLYIETQRIGWGIIPDYFAFVKLHTYWPGDRNIFQYISSMLGGPLFGYGQTTGDMNLLSRLFTILTILFSVLVFALEILARQPLNRTFRLGCYSAGCFMLYFSITGLASLGLASLSRYCMPIWIVLLIALFDLTNRSRIKIRRKLIIVSITIMPAFALAQIWMIRRFTHLLWVA